MSEHTAGKTFGDPHEFELDPLSEDEIAAANAQLDMFHQQVVDAHRGGREKQMSPKFWDDTSGTEYEK